MRTALLASLTLAAYVIGAPAAIADVYRFTDDQGNVLYTDKPRTLPAERLDVKTRKTDVIAAQERQAQELERMQAAADARQKTAAERADARQAAELSAKDKAERCAKARERYDSYMNSQRLYETLPDGERRYLSDTEIDAARASARASMETLCQ